MMKVGMVWPLFAPSIGALGAFIAGSNTVSNLMFSLFQHSVAQRLAISGALIVALQAVGAAAGNMIAIHNVVAASATVGLLGQEGLTSEDIFGSKPIADLHPYTTIMFADLVGFTAWSSVREPTQVFTLLEVVYHAFDKLTTQKRVFKVETVGDCYVAVAGLPEPRKDHAVVMARLAQDCLIKSQRVFKALETVLGPDTGE